MKEIRAESTSRGATGGGVPPPAFHTLSAPPSQNPPVAPLPEHFLIGYCKCNFAMNPHVRPPDGCLVEWLFACFYFLKWREGTQARVRTD